MALFFHISFYAQQSGKQHVFNRSQGSSEYKAQLIIRKMILMLNAGATTSDNQDPCLMKFFVTKILMGISLGEMLVELLT